MAHCHDSDRCVVVGKVQQPGEVGQGVDAEKPRSEAVVYRGQEHRHERRSCIDPPIGDGPVDGLAVWPQLVRLGVSVRVGLLADRDDYVGRRTRDPRVETLVHVGLLLGEGGY